MKAGPNLEYTHPYITEVVKGSTAEEAGLAVGDTILSVDGRDTRQPPMFPDESPGVRHLMRIRRAGEEMELTFVMPASAARSRTTPARPE
jgi:C-terminal processing protease CtpA/Prc